VGKERFLRLFMEAVARFVMLPWQIERVAAEDEVACAVHFVHFSPVCHFKLQGNSICWSTNSIQKDVKMDMSPRTSSAHHINGYSQLMNS
jgi:hypothetical protein